MGPDFKMTALSYVVSLMPPTSLRELELERFGYKVYPQGPYFAPQPDGRYLQLSDDPARRRDEIAKFSGRDADAIERWDEWLGRLAGVLGPTARRQSRRTSVNTSRRPPGQAHWLGACAARRGASPTSRACSR